MAKDALKIPSFQSSGLLGGNLKTITKRCRCLDRWVNVSVSSVNLPGTFRDSEKNSVEPPGTHLTLRQYYPVNQPDFTRPWTS